MMGAAGQTSKAAQWWTVSAIKVGGGYAVTNAEKTASYWYESKATAIKTAEKLNRNGWVR